MTEEAFATRHVGEEKSINITGYLIPWNIEEDLPCWLQMPGTPDLFLPVFSTIGKLELIFRQVFRGIVYKIKHIDDGPEMISSVPYWAEPGVRIRIMIDPYKTEQGTVRYTEMIDPYKTEQGTEILREDDANHNTPETPSS